MKLRPSIGASRRQASALRWRNSRLDKRLGRRAGNSPMAERSSTNSGTLSTRGGGPRPSPAGWPAATRDNDDRRRFRIGRYRPTPIVLVGAALVDRRFHRAAGPCQRFKRRCRCGCRRRTRHPRNPRAVAAGRSRSLRTPPPPRGRPPRPRPRRWPHGGRSPSSACAARRPRHRAERSLASNLRQQPGQARDRRRPLLRIATPGLTDRDRTRPADALETLAADAVEVLALPFRQGPCSTRDAEASAHASNSRPCASVGSRRILCAITGRMIQPGDTPMSRLARQRSARWSRSGRSRSGSCRCGQPAGGARERRGADRNEPTERTTSPRKLAFGLLLPTAARSAEVRLAT